jgi:hypothetical protein
MQKVKLLQTTVRELHFGEGGCMNCSDRNFYVKGCTCELSSQIVHASLGRNISEKIENVNKKKKKKNFNFCKTWELG